MIVVTTSCAPTVALSTPGIPAHTAPAAIPPSSTMGSRIGDGRVLNLIPMAVHAIDPTSSCPSAPMLNRPALKGRATATPVVISGMAKTMVLEISSAGFSPCVQPIPSPPQSNPAYALKGLAPVAPTISAPTANAKTTDPNGIASPPARRRTIGGKPGGRGRARPAPVPEAVAMPECPRVGSVRRS